MCKMKFMLDGIVGHPYGSSFTVHDGHLFKATAADLENSSTDQGFLHSVFSVDVLFNLTIVSSLRN